MVRPGKTRSVCACAHHEGNKSGAFSVRLSGIAGVELRFSSPARLRVGDRFVFLPTVESAIEWLSVPANEPLRERLKRALELLLVARDSRSPTALRASYRALLDGAIREGLVFR